MKHLNQSKTDAEQVLHTIMCDGQTVVLTKCDVSIDPSLTHNALKVVEKSYSYCNKKIQISSATNSFTPVFCHKDIFAELAKSIPSTSKTNIYIAGSFTLDFTQEAEKETLCAVPQQNSLPSNSLNAPQHDIAQVVGNASNTGHPTPTPLTFSSLSQHNAPIFITNWQVIPMRNSAIWMCCVTTNGNINLDGTTLLVRNANITLSQGCIAIYGGSIEYNPLTATATPKTSTHPPQVMHVPEEQVCLQHIQNFLIDQNNVKVMQF